MPSPATRISITSARTTNFPAVCATRQRRTSWRNHTRENTYADDYVTDDIFTALPPQPYQSATYTVKSAPATRILQDRDIIDLGDRHFEVIHTPGHSPGGIALFETATGC